MSRNRLPVGCGRRRLPPATPKRLRPSGHRFKRDYKREQKGQYRAVLDDLLREAIPPLAADQPLPDRFRDHALTGDWKDHRDCHVKPDLVLIYRKPDDAVLQLVRLGSHSELGL